MRWLVIAALHLLVLIAVAPAPRGAVSDDGPGSSKIHPRLRELLTAPADEGAGLLRSDSQGRVQVILEVDEMTTGLRDRLHALGCRVDRAREHLVQAWLPPHALETIAAMHEVRRIRPAEYAFPNGIRAEAPSADRADLGALRTRFGVSGRGVRVGVISIGVGGLAESVANGFLPPGRVTARSLRSDGDVAPPERGGAEGTAVLEIVHRIAPDAELSFAAAGTSLELLDAIDAFADSVDVIVSDIVVHTAFPDGRSTVAKSVADILARPGSPVRAFVQPAGNLARAHYAARYGASRTGDGAGRFHLFRADTATGPETPAAWNRVTVPASGAIIIYLTWDRGDPEAEYRVLLVDCDSGTPRDTRPQARRGSREPPDFVSYRNRSRVQPAEICYAIRRASEQPGSAMLNVTIVDVSGAAEQRFTTPARSILPPADARGNLVVVGAVPLFAPDRIEPFSSQGPTFDGRSRPHVVAVDRLPVSGSGGFDTTFAGTSAAAAYLGGVAALLVEVAPALDAAQLQTLLMSTAVSLDGVNVYGAGRVHPLAAAEAAAGITDPAGDSSPRPPTVRSASPSATMDSAVE